MLPRSRSGALVATLVLGAGILGVVDAAAVPPPNDDFKDAKVIAALPSVHRVNTTSSGSGGPRDCFGRKPTIVGTNKRDRLRGTDARDVILAGGGNDLIKGKDGRDRICGGGGNDQIDAGKGDDRLRGDAGADVLSGQRHNDRLKGDAGADVLLGQHDDDRLRGGAGSDLLAGHKGDDLLRGGTGNDTGWFGHSGADSPRRIVVSLVTGTAHGEGADRLLNIENLSHGQFECDCAGVTFIGDDGPNVLSDNGSTYRDDIFRGGGGDDVLEANTGPEKLYGGPGDDRFVIGLHLDEESDGEDELHGGPGIDTADFSEPFFPPGTITVDLAAGTATGPTIEDDILAAIENVIGTPGPDELHGDSTANSLDGGPGDDVISGRDGDDVLAGGEGNDSIDGGGGFDTCTSPGTAEGAINCESPVGLRALVPARTPGALARLHDLDWALLNCVRC